MARATRKTGKGRRRQAQRTQQARQRATASATRIMPRPRNGEPQYNARMNFKLTRAGRQALGEQAKRAKFGENVSGYLRHVLTADRNRLHMRPITY